MKKRLLCTAMCVIMLLTLTPNVFALKNGDVVWVRRQNELNSGDIGIFYLDGCAYVKEYKKEKGGISLVSHNSAYAPIRVDREDSRIYGRVIYPAL